MAAVSERKTCVYDSSWQTNVGVLILLISVLILFISINIVYQY